MRRSERYAAILGNSLFFAAAFSGGCAHGRAADEAAVDGAYVGLQAGTRVVCRQPEPGDSRPAVCKVMRADPAISGVDGPRRTGTTVVREAGAREGNVVATQTSEGIDLNMTQQEQTKRIELVREGPRADWHGCRQVEFVSSQRSVVVLGEYRATYPRRGTVRESVGAPLRPRALRMLSQADAVVLRLCGVELPVDAAFRRAVADSQRRTIHASLALSEGLTMYLRATPAEPIDETWLSLSVDSPEHEYGGCGVTILANGEALELPVFEYEHHGGEDRYRGRVPLSAILDMAEAVRTVGAVCERRFGLLESHQNQLRDFLMRFKEERSFSHRPAPSRRARAPVEGVTAL